MSCPNMDLAPWMLGRVLLLLFKKKKKRRFARVDYRLSVLKPYLAWRGTTHALIYRAYIIQTHNSQTNASKILGNSTFQYHESYYL